MSASPTARPVAPATARTRQSPFQSLLDGLRLCRRANPRLFFAMVALPLVEALLSGALLIVARGSLSTIIDHADADVLIGAAAPWAIAGVVIGFVSLFAANGRNLCQELLLDRVRVVSADSRIRVRGSPRGPALPVRP